MKNEEFMIVFPSDKQINYLRLLYNIWESNIYVVLQTKDTKQRDLISIKFIDKGNKEQIAMLKEKKLAVLCCHEEAIYWVRKYIGCKWKLQFNKVYLQMVDKYNFKEYLKNRDVKLTRYKINLNEGHGFPVIAKPIIGFGSIGVKKIQNMEEYNMYVTNYKRMLINSRISKYQNEYFSDITNICIFEEVIEGDFFRTPFIVEKGKCKYLFPVKGLQRQIEELSDYHWIEFELNTKDENINWKEMELSLNKVIKEFDLQNGVYVAEFIQDKKQKVYLLEFSPRQTSERIGKIIYLATGLDIEIETIKVFFENKEKEEITKSRIVRLRLESKKNLFEKLDNYELIQGQGDCSLYEDKIESNYYEKKEK